MVAVVGRLAAKVRADVREIALSCGVFVVSLGLLLLRFLVPRPIGASDNGDGWRVLCQLHADPLGRPVTDYYVRFLNPVAHTCDDAEYSSTHLWFARLAQWLGAYLGPPTGLNLVLLGCVYCVFVAAAVGIITLGLRMRWRWKVLAASLLLLLVGDSGFFGYFASVVTEGATFLGIVLTVGGLLLMSREGWWRYTGAVITVFGGVVAVNAKPQAVMILPLLLLALLLIRPAGRSGRARWTLPAAVMLTVTVSTGCLQLSGPDALPGSSTRTANLYHAVFDNIVDGQHDTRSDLAALGLPQSFSRYIGTYYWGPLTALHDPLWSRYQDRFNATNIAEYYLSHPERTGQILNQAATDLLTVRPATMGSFSANAGLPPKAQEWRVPVFTDLMRAVAPLGLVFLLPLWLLLALAGIRAFRGGAGRRELGVVVLFVLGIAVGQFVAGALGEGIEPVKHQVIAGFSTVLAIVLLSYSFFPRPARTKSVAEQLALEAVDHAPSEALAVG